MKNLNTNGFDDSHVQFANFKGTSCRIAYYSVIETTNIALQKLHGSCIEKKIVAQFHIYCHEDTRMTKTLSSLQKWLMISLCTSFITTFIHFGTPIKSNNGGHTLTLSKSCSSWNVILFLNTLCGFAGF